MFRTQQLAKTVILSFLVLAVLFWKAPSTQAVSAPYFPSCLNPQGTLRVSYSSGTHGVPGDFRDFSGSDAVYNLSSDSQLQCLCTNDGGIQTNWWKVSSLSSAQLNQLKSQGWIYIPDGSLWGLDQAPYMAKNANFTCGGVGGFAGTGTLSLDLSLLSVGLIALSLGLLLKKKAS